MSTADLTRTQFPQEFLTIRVHNFKDTTQDATLHGLFTNPAEAEQVARELEMAYPDFLTTEVIPIQFGTIEQVAQAQGVTHITPATADTYAQIRQVTSAYAPGSYFNPTPESLRAEVEGEQELREQMRDEALRDETNPDQ